MQSDITSLAYILVNWFFSAYEILIIASVVLSWIQMDRSSLTDFIEKATQPVLGPIRSVVPVIGGIDFSPFVALLLLRFVRTAVIRLILFL